MVSDAVVSGDRWPYLVALVTLDGDAAARLAAGIGFPADPATMPHDDRVRAEIQAAVDAVKRISRGSSRSSASRSSSALSPTRGRAHADNEGQAAGCLRLLPRDPGRPLRITQCLGVARVQRAASESGCIAASR